MLEEPLKTLVEKKLYTGDSKNHIRSEIYNIVYHAAEPPSIARISDVLHARVQQGLVTRPHITGLLHKVLLVEEAELARYRGAKAGTVPMHIQLLTTSENWLQEQIEAMCDQTLDLLLKWAVSQHINAMYQIATEQRLGAPVHVTDDQGQTKHLNALLRRSGTSSDAAGVNYNIDNVRWCHFNSNYHLWFYNNAVLEGYRDADAAK